MIIKNYDELVSDNLENKTRELRKIGLKTLELAINAVKPSHLLRKSVNIYNQQICIKEKPYNIEKEAIIYIIGAGKATAEMAASLELLLNEANHTSYKGIINIPEGLSVENLELSSKIKIVHARHPVPNLKGVEGTKQMLKLIEQAKARDLVFCLISGGGSALLPLPKEGIPLKDLQKLNSLLLSSGANIHEINAIRKHISYIKGGNLAKVLRQLSEAPLISLIISDVIGDDLDSIASGPTVPDSTTFQDSLSVLKKYNLWEKIPPSVSKTINKGLSHELQETPKPGDPCFKKVHNYLIGSVTDAVEAVQSHLQVKDFHTTYFSNEIKGEAKKFGQFLSQFLRERSKHIEGTDSERRKVYIGSGELTVTLHGNGVGGRNQEMLLSFIDALPRKDINFRFLVLGANLDGIEGNSEAMGALVDNEIVNETYKQEIDTSKYLRNNDSNRFFQKVHSPILTGYTGCNVNDLLLCFIADKI
ncbi:MAG: glycerate kinase [Promethearchaeota archaeon]|nr:MAG: glycerate kinase [Candidatus Lokiarchaeota archaeon]